MAKNSIYNKYYLHVTTVLIRIYSKVVELHLEVVSNVYSWSNTYFIVCDNSK